MGLFGTFGFKENGLYDQYKKVCPNITIQEDVVEQSADYWTRLKTRLASGSGLADVQAIEIGFVADVVAEPRRPVRELERRPRRSRLTRRSSTTGSGSRPASTDGSDTVGLGTDIGPKSICYRSDLLERPGYAVPSPTSSRRSGRPGTTSSPSARTTPAKTGDAFVDSAASIFSTAVYQGDEAYNNADGEPDVENSDGVQTAWSYATQAAQDGITAGLAQFTDPWNKAFSSGAFAAIACPTWMMGYIQGQAGDDYAGKWDVAPVLPGGGAQLGRLVARRSAEADRTRPPPIALVEWLSAKDQQVTMWTSKAQGGHFPSNQRRSRGPGGAERDERRTSATPRSARSSAASPARCRSRRSGSTTRRSRTHSRRS